MVNTNYINDWKKQNTKRYILQLNTEKDADVIKILEGESNKSAFIKSCIRVVAENTKSGVCSPTKDN